MWQVLAPIGGIWPILVALMEMVSFSNIVLWILCCGAGTAIWEVLIGDEGSGESRKLTCGAIRGVLYIVLLSFILDAVLTILFVKIWGKKFRFYSRGVMAALFNDVDLMIIWSFEVTILIGVAEGKSVWFSWTVVRPLCSMLESSNLMKKRSETLVRFGCMFTLLTEVVY